MIVTTQPEAAAARRELHARAYSPWARSVAAVLLACAGASLPALLALVVFANDPPVTPPVLFRLVLVFTIAPGLGAALVGRLAAARVAVRDGELAIERRRVRLEIPAGAIVRVAPWTVPLPGPGVSLGLRSGRRLPCALQLADPLALLDALAELGVSAAAAAAAHPSVVYARAKASAPRPRWYHLAGKFGLFALVPTAVLFNAHQHIAYGALLGEYYLMGLGSWLATLGTYWLTLTIYLVLFASVWRGLAEATALLAARVAPSRAARVRRAVETACRVLYYAGVPVILIVRFLPY
jgi:hypothetical protein